MATLTSLKQMLSSSENNDLREVSFSSYSSSTDENFVGKVTQPIFVGKLEQPSRNPAPFDDHQENETDNHFSRRKKQEDGEIGVFSAEKYFNGVIQQVDHSPRISRFNIPNKYDHHHVIKEEMYLAAPPKPKLHPYTTTTPTSAGSESSWNSQNALLQHKSQSHSQASQPESKIKTKKNNYRKSFLAGLRCKCMCSDSDSVDVEHDQQLGEINSSKKKADEIIVENLEKQRKSLQVFGSPLQDQKKGNSFRMLTTTPGFVNIDDEDEDDSDGRSSSDLFEIESITGKGNPAPSEASIEWSVVTASAADFSVISDYDDIIIGPNHKTAAGAGAGDMKRRGGISLGCKTGKAVSVADRIISNDQAVRRVSDTYMPPLPMKFPSVNNKIMEFDSTPTQRVMSLPRSQHNSHLFYR